MDRLEAGDFEKDAAAIIPGRRGTDFNGVTSDLFGSGETVFSGAVISSPAIVPLFETEAARIGGQFFIQRC